VVIFRTHFKISRDISLNDANFVANGLQVLSIASPDRPSEKNSSKPTGLQMDRQVSGGCQLLRTVEDTSLARALGSRWKGL